MSPLASTSRAREEAVSEWMTNGDRRLTSDGTADAGELIATYRYDGQNRRITRTIEGDPDVTYHDFYNAAWQLLEVRKGSDTDPLKQFVWDVRYVDALVLRWYDADTNGSAVTHYAMHDAQFNITGLVDADTGNVVERYEYTPYGEVTVLDADFTADADNASDFGNRILYCGYRHDPATGLYHVRHRYYHCTLGRWTTRDPYGTMNASTAPRVGMADATPAGGIIGRDPMPTQLQPGLQYAGGMNLYQYTSSTPVNRFDPTGMLDYSKALGEALAYHWFFGNGRTFHGAGLERGLKDDEWVGDATAQQLRQLAATLCKDTTPGNVDEGDKQIEIKPNPKSYWLRHTTNVPSEGFHIHAKYEVAVSDSCCCTVKFSNDYAWKDRADMHPGKYGMDAFFYGLSWWGLGEEYDIRISWSDKSSVQRPAPGGSVSTCPAEFDGWPFED